jgi:hypothetical protein
MTDVDVGWRDTQIDRGGDIHRQLKEERYTVKYSTGGEIHIQADTGRIDSQTVVNIDRGGELQRADTAERYTAEKIHCQAEEERFTIRLVKV